MLKLNLPAKALDERIGKNEISFEALSVYFYPNIDNEYKQFYIIHVPHEWSNNSWHYPPIKLDPFLESLFEFGRDSYYDALYKVKGPQGILQFSQIEPIRGPAYKAEHERLINLSTMTFHSYYESLTPNIDKEINLPIRIFNTIEEWDGYGYRTTF